MRAVVQRVREASVESEGEVTRIGPGLLVYLGVDRDDGEADVAYLVDKVRHVRVFEDEAGKLNLDVLQRGGQVLVVSAFTVQADARHGRRPSFDKAAAQDQAIGWYERFCTQLAGVGVGVERGFFGRSMLVHAINDGPVCLLLESRRLF